MSNKYTNIVNHYKEIETRKMTKSSKEYILGQLFSDDMFEITEKLIKEKETISTDELRDIYRKYAKESKDIHLTELILDCKNALDENFYLEMAYDFYDGGIFHANAHIFALMLHRPMPEEMWTHHMKTFLQLVTNNRNLVHNKPEFFDSTNLIILAKYLSEHCNVYIPEVKTSTSVDRANKYRLLSDLHYKDIPKKEFDYQIKELIKFNIETPKTDPKYRNEINKRIAEILHNKNIDEEIKLECYKKYNGSLRALNEAMPQKVAEDMYFSVSQSFFEDKELDNEIFEALKFVLSYNKLNDALQYDFACRYVSEYDNILLGKDTKQCNNAILYWMAQNFTNEKALLRIFDLPVSKRMNTQARFIEELFKAKRLTEEIVFKYCYVNKSKGINVSNDNYVRALAMCAERFKLNDDTYQKIIKAMEKGSNSDFLNALTLSLLYSPHTPQNIFEEVCKYCKELYPYKTKVATFAREKGLSLDATNALYAMTAKYNISREIINKTNVDDFKIDKRSVNAFLNHLKLTSKTGDPRDTVLMDFINAIENDASDSMHKIGIEENIENLKTAYQKMLEVDFDADAYMIAQNPKMKLQLIIDKVEDNADIYSDGYIAIFNDIYRNIIENAEDYNKTYEQLDLNKEEINIEEKNEK